MANEVITCITAIPLAKWMQLLHQVCQNRTVRSKSLLWSLKILKELNYPYNIYPFKWITALVQNQMFTKYVTGIFSDPPVDSFLLHQILQLPLLTHLSICVTAKSLNCQH
jgi:hypothetical protein